MIKNFTITSGRYDYNVGYVSKQDTYGGIDYSINMDQQMIDDLAWLRQHRKRMELEAKAREENPAIATAYEQYQTVLNLVLDQI